jgi:hypothetical protein
LAAGLATLRPLYAADHKDGNTTGAVDDVVKDVESDITDVYAFTPPGRAGRLVLVMNVGPMTGLTQFSDKVTYSFRVRPYKGTGLSFDTSTILDINCMADNAAGTTIKCAGPNGLSKEATVWKPGDPVPPCAGTEDMCVFAGKRSDPFFADTDAFKKTVAQGTSAFCQGDAGASSPTYGNAFAGFNVSSIVVEVDVAKLAGIDAAVGSLPILGVAAETTRAP